MKKEKQKTCQSAGSKELRCEGVLRDSEESECSSTGRIITCVIMYLINLLEHAELYTYHPVRGSPYQPLPEYL
jgi:hypothetical protein